MMEQTIDNTVMEQRPPGSPDRKGTQISVDASDIVESSGSVINAPTNSELASQISSQETSKDEQESKRPPAGLAVSALAGTAAPNHNATISPSNFQPRPIPSPAFQPAGFPHQPRYRGRVGRRHPNDRPFRPEQQQRTPLTPEQQQISDDVREAMRMYREDKQRQADGEWERKRNVPLIGFMVENRLVNAPKPVETQSGARSSFLASQSQMTSVAPSFDTRSERSAISSDASETTTSQGRASEMMLDILTDLRLQERKSQSSQSSSGQSLQELQITVAELKTTMQVLIGNLHTMAEEMKVLKQETSSDRQGAQAKEQLNLVESPHHPQGSAGGIDLLDL